MSEAHQTPTPPNPTATPPATPPNPDPAAAAPPAPASVITETPPPADPFDAEKLTLPEGFEKDERFTSFTNLAKELGVSHANAQKLVDLHAAAAKASTERLTADWQKTNDGWVAAVKADPEIGGAKLDEVRQTVAKLLDNPQLSDPKFREALDFTGAGNHPAIARTLYRWAKALSEGGSIAGDPAARNANGQADTSRPSLAAAIYGPAGPHSGGPKL